MYLKQVINLNTLAMKRLLLIVVLTITATFAYSQRSIDALFEKYAGKDGFTTVTINGNLLKLFACHDDEDKDNSLPASVTLVRILTQEDKELQVDNFYDMVIGDIRLDSYDEFMRVKESDQDLRMLVRKEGRTFKEFLLIAGGEDNVIIQIKGNMTFSEARKFSEEAKKNHGRNIVEDHN
jgi:hypothetical protein